jgi:pimeloyl-ACP methyl ester carboxylesterase
MWVRSGIAAALARNHRVLALDNRNHGKSDTPQPDGPGRPQDVLELMDHLKIDRAHVHGYSMGGGFTAWMLATHPDRLLSAALGRSGIFETDEKLAAQASALDKPVPPLTSDSGGSSASAAANALLLCEPTERRGRVDHRKRCIGVTVGIACDKSIAVTGFRGCGADGILEIRPGESQRTSDDVVVDRCNGEDANETLHALAGEGRVTSFLEEVEDRRDTVGGHHAVALPALDRCPQRSCDIGIWWTVENDIEEDV